MSPYKETEDCAFGSWEFRFALERSMVSDWKYRIMWRNPSPQSNLRLFNVAVDTQKIANRLFPNTEDPMQINTIFPALPRSEGDRKVFDPAILFCEDNGDQHIGKIVAVWYQTDVLTQCICLHKPERCIGIRD